MRTLPTVTAALAAAVLLAVPATAQQMADPMASLSEAPAYDALHPPGSVPAEKAAAPEAEAAPAPYDPMAAAAQPQTSGEDATVTAKADGEPNPELGGLPDGPGAEETYYQCTACHSTAIIKQQRVTDARWDYLWPWMVEEQGMIEPDPETKDIILAYLKEHFSADR